MDNLDWLREHMKNFLSNLPKVEPTDGIFRFASIARAAVTRDGKVALDLVYEVADVIKSMEDRANETEKLALSIAARAVEELQLAEKLIQELDAVRIAAEVWINEARVTIREAAKALTLERLRVKSAEDQLGQIELRASIAEALAVAAA
jgi:hypothetical protein